MVVESSREALELMTKRSFDVVLVDLRMPDMSALDFLHEAKELNLSFPFIIITGQGDEEAAIAALRLGAYDYIIKRDDYLTHLVYAIEHAISRYQLNVVNRKLLRELETLNKSLEQKVVERTAELQIEINERKRTEAALRESEASLRTLVEYAPDAIVILDADTGKFIDANEKAAHLYGLERADLLGVGPVEMSPPYQPDGRSSQELAREKIAAALAGGVPHFDWVHVNAAGKDIPCEVHLVRLPKAGRNLVRGSVMDVSERRRAERALKESEEKYRLLFSAVQDAIFMIDADTHRIIDANRIASNMYGYSRQEFNGMEVQQLSDEPADTKQALIATATGEKKLRLYSRLHVRKDGSAFPVEISAGVFMLQEKKIICAIVRDVAERKRAEDALRESEMKFRTLVEESLVGVYIIQDGVFAYVNPELARIFGYSVEELTNHFPVERLVAKEDRQMVLENIRRRVAGETESLRYEFHGQRKEGAIINIEVHGARTIFRGKPAVIGMLVDVTERKRAEEQLRLQSTALEAAANSIVITDHEGNIQWANPATTRLAGYELSEMQGKNPRIFKSGHHDQAFYKKLWDTILAGEVWRGVMINRRKDGGHYFEEMTVTPLRDGTGRISHFIAIKQDVTERKRAEEAIRESEDRYRSLFEYSPISLWIEDFSELQSYLEQLRKNGASDLRAYLEQHPQKAIHCLKLIKVLDINKTTLTIYGAKDKNELLKGLAPMIGTEVTAAYIESIMAVAEGKKHFEIETENYTLKKNKIHISLRWNVMPGYEKNYGRVLVSIVDITERKQAELRMQESERRFRMAVNNYPSTFVIYDAKRRLQFVNAVGVKISGYQNDAMLGKRDEELFPAEVTGPYLPTLKKAVRTRQPQSTECTLELAGQKFTIIANYVPLLNEDGEIGEILGITHDITERKRAEEELTTRARQQQALVKLGERALLGEPLETLLQESTRLIAETLNVKYCKILELLPERSKLLLRAGVGWKTGYVGKAKVSAGKRSQAGYTLQSAAPVVVNDLKTEKRFRGPALLQEHNVVSGVSVIIGELKNPFGVLGVHSDEKRSFTENDVSFLQSIAHVLATVIDRKQAEKRIRDSLEEKEVLLKEIHHRVKNNMQVISSLLNLQARKISNPRAREVFKESQNRIRSMALIHERLYLSKDFARVEFADYIRTLTSHLLRVYNVHPNTVQLKMNLEPLVLTIDAAIPCGLIVNELVANCLKHAFPKGKKGVITIELEAVKNASPSKLPERRGRLVIKDNGQGLPKNFDINKTDSLGLRLVNTLVKQISGTLRFRSRKGTQFEITFKP